MDGRRAMYSIECAKVVSYKLVYQLYTVLEFTVCYDIKIVPSEHQKKKKSQKFPTIDRINENINIIMCTAKEQV